MSQVIEPLGRRFFWIKATGEIIAQRGEMSAGIESTKEEDFAIYPDLQNWNPDDIEMTTLSPSQYADKFLLAKSWAFNPITSELIFEYDTPTPETPTPTIEDRLERVEEAIDFLLMEGGV